MNATDIISAIPIKGEALAYWHEKVARSRLSVLNYHGPSLFDSAVKGANCQFSSFFEWFVSLPDAVQISAASSSEFGAWINAVRDAIERPVANLAHGSYCDLVSRFPGLLLAQALESNASFLPSFDIELTSNGGFLLPGRRVFCLVPGHRRLECDLHRRNLTCHQANGDPIAIALPDTAQTSAEVVNPVRSLKGLAPGFYELPRLRANVYLGHAVSEMLTSSLSRMNASQASASGQAPLVTFSENTEDFANDISDAFCLVEDVWPEILDAVAGHTGLICPIRSTRMFSYSESGAPNVIFIRENPGRPLWYAELIIHESCHNWLASLMELIPLITSAQEDRFISPWRADPRPLTGILFGTHAFANVCLFLFKYLDSSRSNNSTVRARALFEADRVARGYTLLQREGAFTGAGDLLMEDLGRLIADLRSCVRAEKCFSDDPALLRSETWPTVI